MGKYSANLIEMHQPFVEGFYAGGSMETVHNFQVMNFLKINTSQLILRD